MDEITILMKFGLIFGLLALVFGIIIFWFIPIQGILVCVLGAFAFNSSAKWLKEHTKKESKSIKQR